MPENQTELDILDDAGLTVHFLSGELDGSAGAEAQTVEAEPAQPEADAPRRGSTALKIGALAVLGVGSFAAGAKFRHLLAA